MYLTHNTYKGGTWLMGDGNAYHNSELSVEIVYP